jgi:multidrug efflux pump subunit AcrA (membrane-fusion protein)
MVRADAGVAGAGWSYQSRLGVSPCLLSVGCGGVRLVPDTSHVPASDEMAWLRARVAELGELNARLRQAARERDELAAAQLAVRDAQIAALAAQIAALAAQVEELQRRLGKDSSTSSRPPSSDSPYKRPRG